MVIATLDVKLKAPNGTNVTVKGKQGFDGVTTGSVSPYRKRNRHPTSTGANRKETGRGQAHS
jgi:hypothetical protein